MASPSMPVSFEDVLAARRAARRAWSVHTPLEYSRALSDRAGGPVFLKCENLQRAGSFKIRGAYTRMSRLSDEEKARGVVAASAGNHAQGVALAAQLLGIRLDGLHAAGRAAAQGAWPPGRTARTSSSIGRNIDDCLVRAREFAARDRRGPDPPVRPPRHRRGAGHRAAWRSSSSAPTSHDPGRQRRRRAAGRHRHRGARPSGRTCGWSGCRPRRPRPTRRRWPPGEPVPLAVDDARWPTASRWAARRGAVRDRARAGRRHRRRSARRACRGPCCSCSSGPSWSSSRPAPPAWRALLDSGQRRLRGARWWRCSRGGNIDPLLLLRVIRHGMAAAGRYLQFRVRVPDRPGSLARAAGRRSPRPTPTSSRSSTCAPAPRCAVDEVEIARAAGDQGRRALRRACSADAARQGLATSSSPDAALGACVTRAWSGRCGVRTAWPGCRWPRVTVTRRD